MTDSDTSARRPAGGPERRRRGDDPARPTDTQHSGRPTEAERPKRRRDAARTKRLILDAAIAEFAAKGFAGARTSEIAARAGVNKQLISYYFGGKDGLARAIGERWQVDEARLSDDSYPLADMVANFSRAAFAQSDMVRLLAWTGLAYRGPDDDDADAPARDRRFAAQLARIRQRQQAGELAGDLDPACVLLAMTAAAAAPVTLPQLVRSITGSDPDEGFAAHYAEQLGRLVRHLAARPGEDTGNTT